MMAASNRHHKGEEVPEAASGRGMRVCTYDAHLQELVTGLDRVPGRTVRYLNYRIEC